MVNSEYPTLDSIELVKAEYIDGQVFYAYQEQVFYQLIVNLDLTRSLVATPEGEWIARVGRQDLYFQYRHNSPLTSRLDPGTTNIIDIYVVTLEYYTAYQNWLKDSTGTVSEPTPPTIDELTTTYSGLQAYKMISDNMIINSAEFKPLFGEKAPE